MSLSNRQFQLTFEQAAVAHRQGSLSEAKKLYKKLLKTAPLNLEVLHRLAMIGAVQKNWQEALEYYTRGIRISPRETQLLNSCGLVLKNLGRFEEALEAFDQAIQSESRHPHAWGNRGIVLHMLNRFEDAMDSYNRAIDITGPNANLLNSRGLALLSLQRPLEALKDFDSSLNFRPDDAETLTNRGVAFREMGLVSEAKNAFEKAIGINTNCALAQWNAAVTHLLAGDFQKGWPLYEWRKKLQTPVELRHYVVPELSKIDYIVGRHIFLYSEQGLGDTIMFYRFVAELLRRGAKVSLASQLKLKGLLGWAFPSVELYSLDQEPASFDFHAALPSLPHLLSVEGNMHCHVVPYISVPDLQVSSWSRQLGNYGFKVGIAWRGGATGAQNRSIPLELFRAIQLPGVRLISLQIDPTVNELAAAAVSGPHLELLGPDFDQGPNSFLDSAAVIKSLDLVVTLDSSVAHLAGALGAPTWVVLPHVPEWRWGIKEAKSAWYPSVKLFRQEMPGDWASAFREIRRELETLIGHDQSLLREQ